MIEDNYGGMYVMHSHNATMIVTNEPGSGDKSLIVIVIVRDQTHFTNSHQKTADEPCGEHT